MSCEPEPNCPWDWSSTRSWPELATVREPVTTTDFVFTTVAAPHFFPFTVIAVPFRVIVVTLAGVAIVTAFLADEYVHVGAGTTRPPGVASFARVPVPATPAPER